MSRYRYYIIALAVVIAAAFVVLFRHAEQPAATATTVQPLGQFVVPASWTQPNRSDLAEALGYGVEVTWDRRLDIIRGLKNLSTAEADTLLFAMMALCPHGVSFGVHSAYMHEIACILQPRQDVREKFARALATLVRDTKRDGITRDYAIQHLRQVWARSADDSALRAAIVSTFREFLHLDISTSALLSLHLLGTPAGESIASEGRSFSPVASHERTASFHIPDADLIPLMEPLFAAKTSDDNIPARLTAIRIVGDRRMKAFRQPLLAILKNPSEQMIVRMAAANAIGIVAEPTDLLALAKYDTGDPRITDALHQALRPRNER